MSASVLKDVKLVRRARVIAASTAYNLALPLVGPLFSLLVIRLLSVEVWGEFVRLLLVAQLAAHVAGWGNKDYLLRAFSLNPAQAAPAWQSSLLTRLALLAVFPLVAVLAGFSPPRVAALVLVSLSLVLYQAYSVVVLYRRDFAFSLGVEVFGLLVLAVPVAWPGSRFDAEALLPIFGLSHLAKAGLFFARFRRLTLPRWQGRFDPAHLRLAFPFFLLGLSGLLQSKIDLYCVSLFLPQRDIGQYHVFINLMTYGQSVSAFILMPFVKNLYRLPYGASVKVAARLSAAGLLILAAFLPLAQLALVWLYGLDLPPIFLVLGGLLIWPIYFYLPLIYAFYRAGRPSVVMAVNFAGVGVSLLLNLLLLPRLGLPAAALASASAQWVMAGLYVVLGRRLQREDELNDAAPVPELPGHA